MGMIQLFPEAEWLRSECDTIAFCLNWDAWCLCSSVRKPHWAHLPIEHYKWASVTEALNPSSKNFSFICLRGGERENVRELVYVSERERERASKRQHWLFFTSPLTKQLFSIRNIFFSTVLSPICPIYSWWLITINNTN